MDDEIGVIIQRIPSHQLYGYIPMESTYLHTSSICVDYHIHGMVQDYSHSRALANGVTEVLH